MQKELLLAKAERALSPFETEHVIKFIKELSVTTIFHNPPILGLLVAVFFYAVIKRSKFVLLFLFTLLTLMVLVRYTLPSGPELSAMTLLPFAFGCLAIGGVLIYFVFIKAE